MRMTVFLPLERTETAFNRIFGTGRGDGHEGVRGAPNTLFIGQRVCVSARKSFNLSTGGTSHALVAGSEGTIDHVEDKGRVGIWFDAPRAHLSLDAGEYDLLGRFFSIEQELALAALDEHGSRTLQELAETYPDVMVRELINALYILERMGLVQKHGGSTRRDGHAQHAITAKGVRALRRHAPAEFGLAPDLVDHAAEPDLTNERALFSLTSKKRPAGFPLAVTATSFRLYQHHLLLDSEDYTLSFPVHALQPLGTWRNPPRRGVAPPQRTGSKRFIFSHSILDNNHDRYTLTLHNKRKVASVHLNRDQRHELLDALSSALLLVSS